MASFRRYQRILFASAGLGLLCWVSAGCTTIRRTECGDLACDYTETCYTCETDCDVCPGSVCGDGKCQATESCRTCFADCGRCASCGDGACGANESCVICPEDCGLCADSCGDLICGRRESCIHCPADCGQCRPGGQCGNGTCDEDESCRSCSLDCGACPQTCGNGACDPDETCQTCPEDCGACPAGCGDGVCDPDETCETCPQDCGECPPVCGDGVCDPTEDSASCPADCGQCDWQQAWADKEMEILDLINQFRSEPQSCGWQSYPAAPPLTMDPELRCAARWHSEDMAAQGYFSHNSLDGRDFMDRIWDAGYTGECPCGENIAAGNSTAYDTMQQWIHSAGHCRNMMSSSYSTIGIGYAYDSGSPYGDYWTQDFGD